MTMLNIPGLAGDALELADKVRDAYQETYGWKGRGKKQAMDRRNLLMRQFHTLLVNEYGLSEWSNVIDALDVARGTQTVEQINTRLAGLAKEQAAAEEQAALDETLTRMERIAKEDEVELLRQLADKHGFRLLAEDTAVELTKLVGRTIVEADGRRDRSLAASTTPVSDGVLLAMFRATDDLRDLRDELARADVINR